MRFISLNYHVNITARVTFLVCLNVISTCNKKFGSDEHVFNTSGTMLLSLVIDQLAYVRVCFLAWHQQRSIALSSQWNLGINMQR